ncbi:MAG: winged helix-turn-helix domain-containing protein [Candidatus Dormibacteraeota bacterium]|jgi:transposase|nr:winged helix-turn-helix domain-containing protein [Candidatus Dormibacteraeota bacterium]
MFAEGARPAEVATALDVSCQAASNWLRAWQAEGEAGLQAAGRAGRLPRLSSLELAEVETDLLKGARENGYPSELWTLRRVAEVIERRTGVSYHPGHVWRILRGLGWSRQKPARKAAERDQEKIEAWVKERWPELKRGPSSGAPGSFSRTRADSR